MINIFLVSSARNYASFLDFKCACENYIFKGDTFPVIQPRVSLVRALALHENEREEMND